MTCMFCMIHYCLQMGLKTLEISVLKQMNLILHILCSHQDQHGKWKACFKKTEVELELLTIYDTLLMVENGNRSGICQASHRYANANNKYINNYDKKKSNLHIQRIQMHIICMDVRCLKNYQKMVPNGQKKKIYQNIIKIL